MATFCREMPGVYGADNGVSHRGWCEDANSQALFAPGHYPEAKVAAGSAFFDQKCPCLL